MTDEITDGLSLDALRERIDALDAELQDLLNHRAELAQAVARVKRADSPEAEPAFYRPEREAQVLRRIKARNTGPMDAEEVARIFREVMSACLALEQPLQIAYLGPPGTFTQAAALKHFGHAVGTLPLPSIPDVFREVESGNCDYGVVPVENSTEGVVSHTLDMFLQSPLVICGEVMLRIHHHLLRARADTQGLRCVYSHQQSLAQCRSWLARHLPGVELVPVASNAEAARLASEQADTAAIAGEMAGEAYQLSSLYRNIEDEPGNTTRFLVIGRPRFAASGHDRTSLLVSTQNIAGGLQRLLAPLAVHGISMTRIESRPSGRGAWDYVFFIDLEGHRDDAPVAAALQALREVAGLYKDLGSYPKAVL